jgi:hypothetical protein
VDTTNTVDWYGYVDGVSDGHSTPMGGAAEIHEVAEYAGNSADAFHMSGGFASFTPRWQRLTETFSWFTIQSSNSSTDAGWTLNGDLANGWSANH